MCVSGGKDVSFSGNFAFILKNDPFQDCVNRFEIDGPNYRKRGVKILHFLIIPLPRTTTKNDEPDSVQRVNKSPEFPKTKNLLLTKILEISTT